MLRQAVTNQLPDIYFPGFHLLPELCACWSSAARSSTSARCSRRSRRSGARTNYSDKVVNLGKVDNTLYGLAVNASLPIMYFNADLVKKAGGDPTGCPTRGTA